MPGTSLRPSSGALWFRAEYPQGIGHLDQIHQVLLRRDAPRVEFTREQVELCERLDKLTLAIWGNWMAGDLNGKALPPRARSAQRFWEAGHRLRDSLFAHAEAIAPMDIAAPEQSDQCLTSVWERLGVLRVARPMARLEAPPLQIAACRGDVPAQPKGKHRK